MGLDMYLRRKTYIGNNYKEPEKQVKIDVPGITQEKVTYVEEEAGYWRKANHIHQWFVDNVQDGEDNCGDYYVSKEQLQELLNTVNKVLDASELVDGTINAGYSLKPDGEKIYHTQEGKIIKDPTVAKELLPTQEGFFFGGTDYDEYYYENLLETKEMLEEIIAREPDEGDYYYHSSW